MDSMPDRDLWTSDQILDVIFEKDWDAFIEFAEKTLDAEITFDWEKSMYDVKFNRTHVYR